MLVCLVVPLGGAAAAEAVGGAVRSHHPDAELVAVWAGDPQLRPLPPPCGATWIDLTLAEPSGVGWNRLFVALDPRAYAVARGARAIQHRLAADAGGVVMLHVGSVAVAGPFADAVPTSGVMAIERTPHIPPPDGLAPDVGDLAGAGRYALAALGFAADAAATAGAIADAMVASGPSDQPGAVLGIALMSAGSVFTPVPGGHAVGWASLPLASPVSLLDVADVDRRQRWRVDFGGRPPRARLSDDTLLAALVDELWPQWEVDAVARLPGGFRIDAVVRDLTADAVDAWRRGEGQLPPEPYGADGSAFVEWLETPWPPWGPDIGRYWVEVRRQRPDLVNAFPHPDGADHDAFVAWIRASWAYDDRSPLLRAGSRGMRPPWRDGARAAGGVNLVGYLGFDKSLGDVARRMHRCLDDAAVPVAALHYHRSGSPTSADTPALTDTLAFDTNIVVVNADQIHLVADDYGDVLFPGRYTIAYWFWELAYIPPSMIDATRLVDEIWVATDFTADALRAVTSKPVRTVPIPVPEPASSGATRQQLGLPEGFVFLVTLDHLSVTERKNPVAAVEAFRRAFPEATETGPLLYVKTLNRSHRWAEHERIRLAAGGRPDIMIVDRHLSRPDQMALTASVDCMVSLHRAEGLGLHLMEAMWLGTPTIATRYSGNLAFMDDHNSVLIDATLVDVAHGEQYFPAEAQWADPDLDQAAEWMRRIVAEPDLAVRLAAAGRAAMEGQASTADCGREIARLSRLAARSVSEVRGSRT